VAKGDLTQRVTISGLIVPDRTVSLLTPYDGYIHKIYVKVGQFVKQGDPVVLVTTTPDGKNEVGAYPLRAPFDGQVVQILKNEGANVEKTGSAEERVILRIDDTKKLYVESDTPEIDYPKLKIGQKVIVKATSMPQKTYKAEIITLFQASKAQTRWERSRVEFPIRVVLLEKDDDLKPGMSVTMDIITAQAEGTLLLRHDFVGKKNDEYFVITEKGEKLPVTVGMRSEEAFEIKSGVLENQKVRQVDFLQEGERRVSGGAGPGRRRGS
jgi:multidrug efflux pump subunit AcrA (membrane-fusion protein)